MRGFLANRVPRIRQTRCHLSRSLVAESGEARGTYRVVTDHYSRYCSWPPRVHSDTVCSCIQLYSHGTSPPLERTATPRTPLSPLSRPGGAGGKFRFWLWRCWIEFDVAWSPQTRDYGERELAVGRCLRCGAASRHITSLCRLCAALRLWFRDWALQHQPDPRRIVTRNEATTNRSAAGQHNGLPFMAD